MFNKLKFKRHKTARLWGTEDPTSKIMGTIFLVTEIEGLVHDVQGATIMVCLKSGSTVKISTSTGEAMMQHWVDMILNN